MFAPTGRPTRRWGYTVVVFLALIGALWWNQHQGIRAVTRDLTEQSIQNCLEIEKLNTRVRNNAIENYAKLDENGRLLHIEITPELRAAAKAELDNTLKQYAAQPCPRGT